MDELQGFYLCRRVSSEPEPQVPALDLTMSPSDGVYIRW